MTPIPGGAESALSLAARVRVREGVLVQELEGETVLLNLDSGMYFGLDATGTRMWQLIAELGRLDDVARAIEGEFDVCREQCIADLLALVAMLDEQGLVAVTP